MKLFKFSPKTPRLVVYTVLCGWSERFNDFHYDRDDIDFVCFTDDPDLRSDFWRVVHLSPSLLDAPRRAKKIKHLPHKFLSEYDWSLYIDNTVRLKMRPKKILEDFLATSPSPLVCFQHPERSCVYDEATTVLELGYDEPDRVQRQMETYRSLGYPTNNGLPATCLLLRRHNDPQLVRVMEDWHDQVLRHSLRDQLSLPVACWLHGFKPHYIDQSQFNNDLMEWPVWMGPRLPRDFDDATYLRLNPDVVGVMHPRRHYLLYGHAEGRQYK